MRNYSQDLEGVRKRLKEKTSSSFKDEFEFKPPKSKPGATEPIEFRFYVLPPLVQGETCATGTAKATMDLFYFANGTHWINNKPHSCPRSFDNSQLCPLCDYAFTLLRDIPKENKESRTKIVKNLLSQDRQAVNIYFPNCKQNPEELRDKVMWFNIPKAVQDRFATCINRDDSDDPADPKAFGVFYDPQAAYLFQLMIGHKSGYNSYDDSKFLAIINKHPIAIGGDKKADVAKIEKILNARHDLTTKFPTPSVDKMEELLGAIQNGTVHFDDKNEPSGDKEVKSQVKSAPPIKPAVTKVETKVETKSVPATAATTVVSAQSDKPASAIEEDPDIETLMESLRGN